MSRADGPTSGPAHSEADVARTVVSCSDPTIGAAACAPSLHRAADYSPDETRLVTQSDLPSPSEGTAALGSPSGSPLREPGHSIPGGGPSDGPLAPGYAFGSRYHIISIIRAGGMGAVYKAWDQELAVVVALKVIRPEVMSDPESARAFEKRFKQELLFARKVTHRNVVRIHDLGDVDGIKYMTMPFIEGEDVSAILQREGALPVSKVMPIARSIVSGLAAAHHAGIVHRDLKPANIMIDEEGEALIMDFGIARSDAREGSAPVAALTVPTAMRASVGPETVAGSVVGTIEYMAPEQARGEAVDHRADIYAFGLILYDMLLGRKRSERAESAIADLASRMHAPPAPLCEVDPALPAALGRIVNRCVQPEAAARFQTTAELAAAVDALTDEGRLRPVQRKLTRKLAGAVGLAFAAVVAFTWWVAPGRAPLAQPKPISVLVADFDNRTSDPVFTGALEQALSISIEGASFINAFPRPKALEIANQNVKAGSLLGEEVARLVARREMIEVVLAGSIQGNGSGYTLALRAINSAADSGSTALLASASASARDKSGVLHALNRAAAELRRRLGDTAEESVRLQAADVFTTSSMESLRTYAQAQEFQASGRKPDALAAFQRAVTQDPEFALAYSGAATMAWETGRPQEAHLLWRKMLTLMDHMTDRERYRALGTYYLCEAANYEKAVENYSAMAQRYPADRYARSNLALSYFFTLNLPRALEEGRRAVELDPKNVLIRSNYALYAMYAGNFDTAAKESRIVLQQDPKAYGMVKQGYLPLAVAAIARGDIAAARETYGRMAVAGAAGASLARMGLADLAMYQARYAEAEAILREGIAEDLRNKQTPAAAEKYVALAEAQVARGKHDPAVKAIAEARRLGNGRTDIELPAAVVLFRSGRPREAEAIALHLSRQLQPQVRAYGKTAQAIGALAERRVAEAADSLTAAVKLADLWLPRFYLGISYVQAEHYAEALAELDSCRKRRGEATALFLNEVPTFRHLAQLPYWLGRAYEGLGDAQAARTQYRGYLQLRGDSPDSLATDARARIAALDNH